MRENLVLVPRRLMGGRDGGVRVAGRTDEDGDAEGAEGAAPARWAGRLAGCGMHRAAPRPASPVQIPERQVLPDPEPPPPSSILSLSLGGVPQPEERQGPLAAGGRALQRTPARSSALQRAPASPPRPPGRTGRTDGFATAGRGGAPAGHLLPRGGQLFSFFHRPALRRAWRRGGACATVCVSRDLRCTDRTRSDLAMAMAITAPSPAPSLAPAETRVGNPTRTPLAVGRGVAGHPRLFSATLAPSSRAGRGRAGRVC